LCLSLSLYVSLKSVFLFLDVGVSLNMCGEYFSPDSDEMIFFTGESNIMDRGLKAII